MSLSPPNPGDPPGRRDGPWVRNVVAIWIARWSIGPEKWLRPILVPASTRQWVLAVILGAALLGGLNSEADARLAARGGPQEATGRR